MQLGYIAIEERTGETVKLAGLESPRKQLLTKLGAKSAKRMFVDTKDGTAKHIGYIVRGQWFRLFEIHNWERAA